MPHLAIARALRPSMLPLDERGGFGLNAATRVADPARFLRELRNELAAARPGTLASRAARCRLRLVLHAVREARERASAAARTLARAA